MLYLIVHVEAEILLGLLQLHGRNLQNARNVKKDGEEYRWQHIGQDQESVATSFGPGSVVQGVTDCLGSSFVNIIQNVKRTLKEVN